MKKSIEELRLCIELETRLMAKTHRFLKNTSNEQIENLDRLERLELAIKLELVHEFSAFLHEKGSPERFRVLNECYETVLKRMIKGVK